MNFYTDGSRINMSSKSGHFIGWAAVCDYGLVCSAAQVGGSNINAEIFAIRDLLVKITSYKKKLVENETEIKIITDSLTSIQIINGYLRDASDYDLSESVNYEAADEIVRRIKALENLGKNVEFVHIKGHADNLGNSFADYAATQESMLLKIKTEGF